jgi:epoxide hydrolase-like predicted phosphatase
MASVPVISAVIWDLGGVILRTEDTSPREKWEERFGLGPWGLEKLVFANEVSREASVGGATVDDIWERVQQELKLHDEEMDGFKKDFFSGDEIDFSLVDFIRDLKRQVKSGMITNAWPRTRHFIENVWEIADAFDEIIVSAEVNLVKPDPRIYQMALDQLKVKPEEAVFIDDFKENIRGAEEVGMVGIHFRDADEVVKQLRAMLELEG